MSSGRKGSSHEEFCAKLTPDDRTLIALRDEIYSGSWDLMLGDLKDRLEGKPYIFKLVNRIQEDIQRIEKLREYERKNRINLADYLKKKEAQ